MHLPSKGTLHVRLWITVGITPADPSRPERLNTSTRALLLREASELASQYRDVLRSAHEEKFAVKYYTRIELPGGVDVRTGPGEETIGVT